ALSAVCMKVSPRRSPNWSDSTLAWDRKGAEFRLVGMHECAANTWTKKSVMHFVASFAGLGVVLMNRQTAQWIRKVEEDRESALSLSEHQPPGRRTGSLPVP